MAELLIVVPAAEPELRANIERSLEAHADVFTQPAASFDLETIRMIVEVAAGGLGVLKTLLEIRKLSLEQRRNSGIKVGRPGDPGIPLEQADETLLRELLELEPL